MIDNSDELPPEYTQLAQMLANELLYIQHGETIKKWVEEILRAVDTLVMDLSVEHVNNLLTRKFEDRKFNIHQSIMDLQRTVGSDS